MAPQYAPQAMQPQYAPQVVVQQYQPPAMAQPARPVRARKGSGMGVTALIFGIFGMIFSFIFFLPPVMVLGWLFCLLAFIFGIISAATGRGRGMGIAGLIMSLIPLIVLIVGIAAGGGILGGIMGDLSYML